MAVVGVVLAAVLSGCGGSGSPAVSETSGSPAVTPAATLPARGGLVGVIDSARKVAVCANVQLYDTTVEGGLQSSADEAFKAVVQTLRQTPRDPSLLALVRRWRNWRATVGDAVTARRLTAFCA
jgi:hypothetical protein